MGFVVKNSIAKFCGAFGGFSVTLTIEPLSSEAPIVTGFTSSSVSLTGGNVSSVLSILSTTSNSVTFGA